MSTYVKKFAEFLQEGESVEWAAQAEPFILLDNANKQSLLMRWVISTAVAVLLVGGYLFLVSQNDVSVSAPVVLVLLFFPLFAALRPVYDARILKRNAVFAITDRRVLSAKGGPDFFSIAFDDISAISYVEKAGGVGDVLFGTAVNSKESKLRIQTLLPQMFQDESKTQTGLIFYNVKDLEKVKSYLDERVRAEV